MADLTNLKVCFLALTLGQGGAERQLYYMLKVLKAQGAVPYVLSLTRGEFWEERIRALGVPVIWVGQRKPRWLRLIRIIMELRKDHPDILQSQYFFTNLYAVIAARVLGVREIAAVRNDGVTGIQSVGKVASYLCLHAPRLIAANSRAALQNLRGSNISPAALFFLPNVVDTDHFYALGRQAENPVKLVAVGRLVEQKRFDRFLSVLHKLRQDPDLDFKGIIVGSGHLRSQLEQQAVALGLLPGMVEFRGGVDDVADIYREADIFVLTSDWEGTPNVVLEAMASGLPVVSTRVGGVAEVVRHGETGYLSEPGDETRMVFGLARLINDVNVRTLMGRRAREHVVANHSLHYLPLLLGDLYERALSGNKCRLLPFQWLIKGLRTSSLKLSK